jgi:hypothetical protein
MDPGGTAHANARWEQQVYDIEVVNQRKEEDRVDGLVAESLRQQGHVQQPQSQSPTVKLPAPPRSERLFDGPFDGKLTNASPTDRRINLPAGIPSNEQHRYERNDSAKFVWRGRADGRYPRVRVIGRSSRELCFECGDDPREMDAELTTALYCSDASHFCSKCDEQATREVDVANFSRNVLLCRQHLSSVIF